MSHLPSDLASNVLLMLVWDSFLESAGTHASHHISVNSGGCAMTVDGRRDYFALLLMYRIIQMHEPPFLLPLFTPYHSDRPTRGRRKDLDITKQPSDTFQVRFAKMWNSVPQSTRDLPSYSCFKRDSAASAESGCLGNRHAINTTTTTESQLPVYCKTYSCAYHGSDLI